MCVSLFIRMIIPTFKDFHTSTMCGHWMLSGGRAKNDRRTKDNGQMRIKKISAIRTHTHRHRHTHTHIYIYIYTQIFWFCCFFLSMNFLKVIRGEYCVENSMSRNKLMLSQMSWYIFVKTMSFALQVSKTILEKWRRKYILGFINAEGKILK